MSSRALAAAFFLVAAGAHGQGVEEAAYSEVFYSSGDLRIQAYLYQPDGAGPFPVVIYNHGTRDGREAASVPFQYIGKMLTRAGYIALVPERRGYGKSDGAAWRQEVGSDPSRLIPRLQAETDDVLAAIGYLRTVPSADIKRVGIMGWSFGGIVTMLAVSRSSAFSVAIDQAGGSLTWDASAPLRRALIGSAEKATTPTLFMVARNDRTTLSVTTLAERFRDRGIPYRLVLYDPFTPAAGTGGAAPGHALFSAQGAAVWENDVVEFIGRYLRSPDAPLIDAVLADFAQRTDTMSMHKNGIVLIERETAPWTLEKVRYFTLGRDDAKCPIDKDLYADLAARNPAGESVAALVTAQAKWRLVGKEADDFPKGRVFLDKTASGEEIKTVVVLSKPAYSPKGDAALVLFHFAWSMHSAIAQYLLRKDGAEWKVSCSDLKFYP